jgi:hypothetical protein
MEDFEYLCFLVGQDLICHLIIESQISIEICDEISQYSSDICAA